MKIRINLILYPNGNLPEIPDEMEDLIKCPRKEISLSGYTDEKHSKRKIIRTPILRGVLFSVVPIIDFYLMEFYDRNPFEQIRPQAHFFNILLFEMIAWILLLVTSRPRIALGLLTLLNCVWGLGNHYVYAFRSTPLMPWDLFSVKTAASVASNYDFTPSGRMILITALFAVLLAAVMIGFRWKVQAKWQFRFLPAALIAVCLGIFGNMLQDSDFQTQHNLYPFLFTPNVIIKYDGMAVAFTMELQYLWVEKPSGYSQEEAKQILEEYADADTQTYTDTQSYSDTQSDTGTDADANGDLPNIIVIMDEAFSDLSVITDFETNEDYMPFVHSLMAGQENTVSGYLNVSVCGGNTADTEFEFLTGNTMAFLPAGSIPYQQYIRDSVPSLASWLSSLGYETYAQHPYYGSGWNRQTVYPLLGFDNLSFLDSYQNRTIIRQYVSDEDCFDKIIETYEKNKESGKPAFIFNVTMQNHGGYTDTYEDFTNTITAGLSNDALDQYLSLIKITDADLQELISYFEKENEKTVIVFFGDHQPNNAVAYSILAQAGMNYADLTEEEQELRYQVPYFIWANYDIEEETGADTSANYLSARLLQKAGVPTSDYQNFLLELEEDWPIISAVREEEAADADPTDAQEQLNTYEKLQYYRLFDWEN